MDEGVGVMPIGWYVGRSIMGIGGRGAVSVGGVGCDSDLDMVGCICVGR